MTDFLWSPLTYVSWGTMENWIWQFSRQHVARLFVCWIFIKALKNNKNHLCLTFRCDCWVASMVNLWKRYVEKLRNIILLQFELIASRFALGRDLNSSVLWFRDFLTRTRAPQPIWFILGDTRIPNINQETNHVCFK